MGLVAGVALTSGASVPGPSRPVGAPTGFAVTLPRPADGVLVSGERRGDAVLVRVRAAAGVLTLHVAPDAAVDVDGGSGASSVQGLLALLRRTAPLPVRFGYDVAGQVSL